MKPACVSPLPPSAPHLPRKSPAAALVQRIPPWCVSSLCWLLLAIFLTGQACAQGISFSGPTGYSAGATQVAVAVGDVNGDGEADLVTASFDSSSVSVLLGTGGGAFAAPVTLTAGSGTRSVALGDMNLDGNPDILAANRDANTISVFLGNGVGGFSPKVDIMTGSAPLTVRTADLNRDSIPDMVVSTNTFPTTLSVHLGNGDGTFQPRVNYNIGDIPISALISDLNSDGNPDVVAANQLGDTVSVRLGNGDGTLGDLTTFDTGSGPISLAAGDFDGNGSPDLVTVSGGNGSVSILLGNGDGTFAARTDVYASMLALSVTTADVDSDGDLDLLVSDYAGTVKVLLGNGSGSFVSSITLSLPGTRPREVAVGDFDQSGRPDFVTANETTTSVSVMLNTTSTAPTVDLNTVDLALNATTLTITGTNFDAETPGNNIVAFSPAGTGTVTAATATSLTVTGLSGLSLGALRAVVTRNSENSGAAVQVATVVPPPSPGGVVQLDASALVLANGASVAIWGGQTAGNTPTYQTAQTPNGGPAVEFNGTDRLGEDVQVPTSTAQDWIYVAVIKPLTTHGAYHNLIDDDPGSRPMLWIDGANRYEFNYGGATRPTAGQGPGGWDIVIADSRLNRLYVNSGTTYVDGGAAIPYATGKAFDFFHRDGSASFKGQVAEVRLYNDRAAFGGDIAALYDELYDKWLATPAVTAVSPAFGSTLGGTMVTITGENFTDASSVTFNGAAATSVNVVNDTTISAVTPEGTAGPASVLVTTPRGTNAANTAFTYVSRPTVTNVSPPSGPLTGGTTVTITGTGFTGVIAVTFDEVDAASYTVDSATQITAVTPAASIVGGAQVQVANGSGISGEMTLFEYVTPSAAEIAAYQGTGTAPANELADATGVVDFTITVPAGAPVTRQFTIENEGPDPLNLGTVALSGSDAAQFGLTQPAALVLAQGETTTFTVSFAPTTDGFKQAEVRILSNDMDENPFRIRISGTGRTAPRPRVLVLSQSGRSAQIAAMLADTGILESAAGYDVQSAIPSVADLLAYDAVLVSAASGPFYDNTALGNRLVDFLNAGGGVVVTGPHHSGLPLALAGRWASEGRGALGISAATTVASANMIFEVPAHPVFHAVGSIGVRTYDGFSLEMGATRLAGWSVADHPALAIKGAVINIGIETAAPFNGFPSFLTGGYPRLLANALTVTADATPAPATGDARVAVFNGAGTAPADERADNAGTVDFGISREWAQGTGQTFTLQNTGTTNLVLNSMMLTGADPADFALTPPVAGVILPGQTASFSVRPAPQGGGTKNAVLEIASNAANITPFRIPLTTLAEAAIPSVVISGVSSELASGLNRGAVRVVDGSGFSAGGHTNAANGNMWLSHGTFASPNDPLPAEITFDLGARHEVTGLHVWNYNEFTVPTRGARDVNVSIATSRDGPFTPAGSLLLPMATGQAGDPGSSIAFTAAEARYVRFEITSNHGGDASFAGLSEVKFFGSRLPVPVLVVEQPAGTALGQPEVISWGSSVVGSTAVPEGLGRVRDLALGNFSVAVLEDGTVRSWGSGFLYNAFHQVPAGVSGVARIATSRFHTLALKATGEVVAWGHDTEGQSQVPAAAQSGVIDVSAGEFHSLALKGTGEVLAWGLNDEGQTTVPLPAQSGVVAIAAGYGHSVALKADGTVVAWGLNNAGQCDVPAGLTGVTKIAAGDGLTLALKADGTVVAWGLNSQGQANVPAGLDDVVDISAGSEHSLALKSDGTVVAWGSDREGQVSGASAASGVTFLAKGYGATHALAYKRGAFTDFGLLSSGGTASRTYVLKNTGNAPLLVSSVTITGADAADFLLDTTGMASSIAAGDETAFNVSFHPGGVGPRQARLEISSNDEVSPVFTVELQGTGVGVPVIAIRGNGQIISSGDSEPTLANHTYFGTAATSTGSVTRRFTIQSTGTAALNLTGVPLVNITGDHAAEFTVTSAPAALIATTGSTTFEITFSPTASGLRTASVRVLSDASATPDFTFAISGTGAGAAVPQTEVVESGTWLNATEGLLGGGRIARPLAGVINQAGFVTFRATGSVGTGGITSGNDSLLLSNTSGSLQVVAREGHMVEVSPWSTLAGAFGHFLLTDQGQSVALDRILGAPTSRDYAYLASPEGVALEILSREGDAAPSAGTFKTHTAKPAADSLGRLYFSGSLMGTGITTKDDTGIYQESSGTLVEIIREGDDVSVLTTDPAWLGAVSNYVAAAADGVAFSALLQNNPADAKQKTDTARNALVLAGNESGLEILARKGNGVPDLSGATLKSFSGVSRAAADSHAYLALMNTGSGITTANDQVLVAVTATGSHLVAREGVTQAEGVTLVKFADFYATRAGAVIFEASGVLCRWTEAEGIAVLARLGGAAPGTGSTHSAFTAWSVSEGGAVALHSRLANGRNVLWRALPGEMLTAVIGTGDLVEVSGTDYPVLTLTLHNGGSGTGGGGGGMGAAINDAGEVFVSLSLGGSLHVGRVLR